MSWSDAQRVSRLARSWLPSEHGFWVMLCAALITAIAQGRASARALTAGAVVFLLAIAVGASIHRRVRGSGNAQLASAATVSFVGVPIALWAGVPARRAVVTALAWAAVFVAGALVVRGTFARARSASRVPPEVFDRTAVLLCSGACVGFFSLGFRDAAWATGLGALCSIALVESHPTVRELKRVGLALAALSAVAAVVLAA